MCCTRDWQTTTCGPDLALYLFIHGWQAQQGFYIFKWLKNYDKEDDYFMIHKNYVKFEFQCP